MDTKLNHSDLSSLLAKEVHLSQSKADLFTKIFFDIIIEGLEKDGIVKINGLGTFKMVDVASRNSINVNTGEKFEIKGHKKLTFTPADTLKEKVNQPFAMFEPVEVNDDYVDEETECVDVVTEETEINPIADDSEEIQQEPVVDSENIEIINHNEEKKIETEIETEKNNDSNGVKVTGKSYKSVKRVLSLLLIILLVGVCYYIYKHYTYKTTIDVVATVNDVKTSNNVVKEELIVANRSEIVDTIIESKVTVKPETTEFNVEEKPFFVMEELANRSLSTISLKDTTIYRCSGNISIHKVGLDETLTRISLKYYNDKRLWPYIVKHNNMQNYNQLAIGMELAIPRLVPKE